MAEVMARIHPEDAAKLDEARAAMRDGQGDGELEYRLLLPDGNVRWIMVRHHMLLDDRGQLEKVIGVGVDVTRQRELEERLRQAQKMEAVGQLTGGLAHDFNNLLTAISGGLEMMQMRLKQGRIDDLQRYIGAAQTASGRAAALTHRLLAFSRRQPLDPRPVDANRLIAGMEDLIRGTVGPGIGVEVIGGEGLWPTLVDPNQLENALLNLCINARDAMPDGGRLTIETANVWLDDRAGRERDLAPGPYLSLCVGDTGTGMSPAVIARAFDPFFTTKPMGQGTGLGLSMIYGFARQSGGQVRIRSAVGRGHDDVPLSAAPSRPGRNCGLERRMPARRWAVAGAKRCLSSMTSRRCGCSSRRYWATSAMPRSRPATAPRRCRCSDRTRGSICSLPMSACRA